MPENENICTYISLYWDFNGISIGDYNDIIVLRV